MHYNPPKPSTMRKRGELRAKNIVFLKQVREAKDRQTLRTEQMQLHSMLHTTVAPGLRDRIRARADVVGNILG